MKSFQRILVLSILGTYLVILAGAVVRGTGSGLGCPDWPRCFGQWVPPTDISQLPENYKEVYKIAGKTIADFEPMKTWTEYINRLLGVVLGFLIVLLFGFSFKAKSYERNLPWYTAGLLVLILIQGGIGALVVSTHLKPYIITIHMFLAIVLLFGLLYLKKYCDDLETKSLFPPVDRRAVGLTKLLVAATFVQVLMGTQVRQQVDHFMRDTLQATKLTIIDHLGAIFYVHRSFSVLVVAGMVYLLIHLSRSRFHRRAFFLALCSLIFVFGNILTGIALNYFDFPASAQPLHLFFGVLSLGLLYSVSLNVRGSVLGE